jgi:hypothetical protein
MNEKDHLLKQNNDENEIILGIFTHKSVNHPDKEEVLNIDNTHNVKNKEIIIVSDYNKNDDNKENIFNSFACYTITCISIIAIFGLYEAIEILKNKH